VELRGLLAMTAKGNARGRWWPLKTEQMTTEVVRAKLRHSAKRRRVIMQLARRAVEAPVPMPRDRLSQRSRTSMTLFMQVHRCVRVLKERGEVLSLPMPTQRQPLGSLKAKYAPSHAPTSQTPTNR
jgi:hypothetical protein